MFNVYRNERRSYRLKIYFILKFKFKSPDIVTVIKVRREEWLGHVLRMDGASYWKANEEKGDKVEDLD